MNKSKSLIASLAFAAATLTGTAFADDGLPAIPATPTAVTTILHAEPFILDQPFTSDWQQERPQVSAGYLLVLEVDPALVYPRALPQPVLYVGDATAERVNHGHESGRIVVIVPSSLDEHGHIELDLTTTRIWFGTPELPEQVDAATIAAESRMAQRAGIRPMADDAIELALAGRSTDDPARHDSRDELLKKAGELIEQFSPTEAELGRALQGLLPEDVAKPGMR